MPGIGGAITPEFVFDLESRMRILTNNAYSSLLAKLWWQTCTSVLPSKSKRELLFWLLDSAGIQYEEEGNIEFEELAMQQAEYTALYAAKGLKVIKGDFEDLDGNGVKVAESWSRQQGAYAAYFPQKHVAARLNTGHASLGYDGENFFSTDHPLNPLMPGSGVYSNLITTDVKLDDRHTITTAFGSLKVILKALAAIKQPNGEDPRNLRPAGFLAPTAMVPRLTELLSSSFLSINGGSQDVTGVISKFGFGQVTECVELGAAYGGSDTNCYLLVEDVTGESEVGPLVWVEREPFEIMYYSGRDGGQMSADLGRTRELEWHIQGRNVASYGHPYKMLKLVGQAP